MTLRLCGTTWQDDKEPCPLGNTSRHECWNGESCNGGHLCACEAEPR